MLIFTSDYIDDDDDDPSDDNSDICKVGDIILESSYR